jgi:polyphosphate:AMP phosphotransferase
MLEMAELGNRLSKEEYAGEVLRLRPALLEMQLRLRERPNLAVVVVVAGAEGAGKHELVNLLSSWLDPRGVEVNAFGLDDESRGRPPFYRFWMHLPPKGKLGFFFGSWYSGAVHDFAVGDMKRAEFARDLERITTFERHLAAEGVLVVKFWLHLSKAALKRRHRKLRKSGFNGFARRHADTEWVRRYEDFLPVAEEALRVTSTGEAPWHVVEASDQRYEAVTVLSTLVDVVGQRLQAPSREPPLPMPIPDKEPPTVLAKLDLVRRVDKNDYAQELQKLQAEVHTWGWKAYEHGVSAVAVFEGWDAAGKGGCIRRLTQGLDARNTRVVSIASPTDEEKAHPYLWRFWRHLPTAGTITVFDRSWYGRVLVERVEGFCWPEDWQRAFGEINDFEAQMVASGVVLVKYWLHVSREEQLRRFHEREVIPFKQYKLTPEDWRNREKWNAYLKAVDEMLGRTSTTFAPWTLVAAEDKLCARLRVLETMRDALRDAVRRTRKHRRLVKLS